MGVRRGRAACNHAMPNDAPQTLLLCREHCLRTNGPPTLVSITLLSSCGLPMAHLCYFVSLWLSNSNKSSSWPLCLMQVSRAMKGLGLRLGELRVPFTQIPTCRTI
ncbi:hypothetical protein QQF64_013803 [Cirrhinus molitorella]|uniref:Uncharacterized protein n=1 Tax=Cirrhinus molitorella TaxID=172907 RepID=A0ABR3LS61_9TELE